MQQKRFWAYAVLTILLGVGVGLIFCPTARAISLNASNTLELKGKVATKFSFKTQDSRGFATMPSKDPSNWPDAPNLDAWDMIQQRNIAYIEGDYTPGRVAGWDMKFHATGRFLYDTIYELGPDEIQAVRDFNSDYKDDIDDLSKDVDLWEGYANFSRGPLFVRIGRQKISWGETDIYPLLDRIMPIDNTYGGIFEDLDDRRIPLWAIRGTYNFGDVSAFNDLGLEFFWEPSMVDPQFAPQTPWGAVYNFPQASGPPLQLMPEDPDDDLDNSRWGMRLQGILANNFNFALAFYQSYPVDPALKSKVDTAKVFTGDTKGLMVEKHWITTKTLGGSFSFFEEKTEAVIRGELAYTFNEPYFDPYKNFRSIYAFMSGVMTPPESEIPEWDVLRFSLAFDRPFWFRMINNKSMINWTVELSNEYYPDYDGSQVLPAPVYDSGDFVKLHEWEHTALVMLYTSYLSGKLEPNITAAYNPRGAGFWQASLQYRMDPFLFKIQYNDVFGDKDKAPGLLYDWDQISATITWTF